MTHTPAFLWIDRLQDERQLRLSGSWRNIYPLDLTLYEQTFYSEEDDCWRTNNGLNVYYQALCRETLPREWKNALLVFIYKIKVIWNDSLNCRSISLLDIIVKSAHQRCAADLAFIWRIAMLQYISGFENDNRSTKRNRSMSSC